MDDLNFHDGLIYKVEYNMEDNSLVIGVIEEGKRKRVNIIFHDVLDWFFSEFEKQNIIFEIRVYKEKNELKKIIDSENLSEYYRNAINESGYIYAEINSSAGMNGSVFSKEVTVEQQAI